MSGDALEPGLVAEARVVAESVEIRRDLHGAPELAFEERRTAALVADRLRALGLDVAEEIGGTGVVGVLNRSDGPMIGLRADMDALPIVEENSFPHVSRHRGRMHACGHDGHTAALLGAAAQLVRTGRFTGSVAFVFQPAEENEAGAKAMIEDGLFERFPIAAIYGAHNFPGLPIGAFTTRVGAMMASFDKFEIEVSGSGGHSSAPHTSTDALRAAAAIAGELPDTLRRRLDPLLAAVISVTALHADGGYNIVPRGASLKGSFRTLDPTARETIAGAVTAVAAAIAGCHGCTAETRLFPTTAYPVTVNSAHETELAVAAARLANPDGPASDAMAPLFGSEDFAFYLRARPGNFIGFGNGRSAPLHTPRYDFNDAAIPFAIAYWHHLAHVTAAAAAA